MRLSRLCSLVLVAAVEFCGSAAAVASPFTADSSGTFAALGAPPVFPYSWSSHFASPAPFGWADAEGTAVANLITGAITDGVLTITAANGDRLFGTYGGLTVPTADPTVLGLTSRITFTGGTGEFSGMTGSCSLTGGLNVATATNTLHWEGALVPEPGMALGIGMLLIGMLARPRH